MGLLDILTLKKKNIQDSPKYMYNKGKTSGLKQDVALRACNLILNQLKYDTEPTRTVLIECILIL